MIDITTKYFHLVTSVSSHEYPPKLYLDFWKSKPNLRFNYRDSHTLHFELGFFGKYVIINVKWGYREREMTEFEKDIRKSTEEFLRSVE